MSTNNNENLSKAFKLLTSFKEQLLYKNRFIIKHEVLDHIREIAKNTHSIIEKDTILYRARLFTGDGNFLSYMGGDFSDESSDLVSKFMKMKYNAEINGKANSGFWGYDSQNSFVTDNDNLISDGRANPSFIKYLYTAERPYTAMVEIRPYLKSKVNIAEIRVKEKLNIADFSYKSLGKLDGMMECLAVFIMMDFSKPSNYDIKSYIPTQYIAEFIKILEYDWGNFDGIRFNSSLDNNGINVTIFNYNKCEPIGSKLYEINDICYDAKGVAPKNENNLRHYKLNPTLLPKLK